MNATDLTDKLEKLLNLSQIWDIGSNSNQI